MAAKAEEKLIGRITHYYSHLSVGIIELMEGELKVGDVIHVKGTHTDFRPVSYTHLTLPTIYSV